MPIHDWTRVNAGTFHDFHQTWIIETKRALNAGLLPPGFYAMAEQIAGGWGPDVLTLEAPDNDAPPSDLDRPSSQQTAVAVADHPPQVTHHATAEVDRYASKASPLSIRHASNHRVVAMIEIVSPGNKSSQFAVNRFVEKAVDMLESGIHLLVIDLFPPGNFDRTGIHSAIWQHYSDQPLPPSPQRPLTLASYIGGPLYEAYVEPRAVGQPLVDMPLFLDSRTYVPLPLEKTYQAAWDAVPAVWRRALEASANKS